MFLLKSYESLNSSLNRVWLKRFSGLATACIVLVFLVLRSHFTAKDREYWRLAQGDKTRLHDHALKLLFVGNSFIHYNGGAEKALVSPSVAAMSCSRAHL